MEQNDLNFHFFSQNSQMEFVYQGIAVSPWSLVGMECAEENAGIYKKKRIIVPIRKGEPLRVGKKVDFSEKKYLKLTYLLVLW